MPFVPLTPEEQKTWEHKPCLSPEHNPPSHMVIQEPKKWKCPCCGQETSIFPTKVYW